MIFCIAFPFGFGDPFNMGRPLHAQTVCGEGDILFVTKINVSGAVNARDRRSIRRLEREGYSVIPANDAGIETADADGKILIIVSETSDSPFIEDAFRDVAIPFVTWEGYLYDNMGMTGDILDADYGLTSDQTSIAIVDGTHPLAVGLAGTVVTQNRDMPLQWGVPDSTAIKIATMVGAPERFAIFAYESGASMFGFAAPARRVGIPSATGGALNENGWAYFDAAVDWAINCSSEPVPATDTPTPEAVDTPTPEAVDTPTPEVADTPTPEAIDTPVPALCGDLEQEAEDGTKFGDFELAPDLQASGGAFVHVPEGSPDDDEWDAPNPAHRMDYCFTVREDGEYAIYGTVYSIDEVGDSFWVRVNDAPDRGYLWAVSPDVNEVYVLDYVNDRDSVVDPVTVELTAGEHTVSIYLREDGTRLDTIGLRLAPEQPTNTPVPETDTPIPPADTPTPTETPTPIITPTPDVPLGNELLIIPVGSSSDDAEEILSNGSVNVGSADLELGAISGQAQIIGIRFANVAIPAGATITRAYIEFTADEDSTQSSVFQIRGEKVLDASPFGFDRGNISRRVQTETTVSWSVDEAWDLGSVYGSKNIAPIVQGIIDLDGWVSGNSIAVTLAGVGGRSVASFEASRAGAFGPRLIIVFDPTGGPQPRPTETPASTETPEPDPPSLQAKLVDNLVIDADGNRIPSPGDTVEYAVRIVNSGDLSATGVQYASLIDENMTLQNIALTTGDIVIGSEPDAEQLLINLGDVAGNSQIEFTYTTVVNSPIAANVDNIEHFGVVSSNELPDRVTDDPDQPGMFDATLVSVSASPLIRMVMSDLLLVDADQNSAVTPGDVLLFIIDVVNIGNADAANIMIENEIDSNTTLLLGTVLVGQGEVQSGNLVGDTKVVALIDKLAGGGSSTTVSFQVTVKEDIETQQIVHQAAASGHVDTVGGASMVLSDDPDTAAFQDSTITLLSTNKNTDIAKLILMPISEQQ